MLDLRYVLIRFKQENDRSELQFDTAMDWYIRAAISTSLSFVLRSLSVLASAEAVRPGHQVSEHNVGHQIQGQDMVKLSKKSQNREKFSPIRYYSIE